MGGMIVKLQPENLTDSLRDKHGLEDDIKVKLKDVTVKSVDRA
jgi:hypothetical protein